MSNLVTIVMDQDEIINTTKGPIRLLQGQSPDVEDWMAASLVGRGKAHYPVEEKALTPLPDDLEKLTVAELRSLARERGVEDYHMLRKKELLDILGPAKVEGDPAPQKFEKINLVPEGTVLKEPGEADEEKFLDGE